MMLTLNALISKFIVVGFQRNVNLNLLLEISLAGKIEKQNHQTTKGKANLKNAANEAKKEKVRPVSKKKKSEMKAARESLASGELAAEDQVRRTQRDLCSLYIR